MKIRLGTPEATLTVPGTISRPQLIATDRDSARLMRAEQFEAELRLYPVEDAPGTLRWEVATLTVRGRRVDGRRTTDAWASCRFYHPAVFRDGVPDWVLVLAEQVLPDQPPPRIARRVFSIPDQPKPKTS
ncbi:MULTISPECIES: hypothetical protein [unclassified Streptomyces]|uniref:hypothetical protein n=1 Tax=unclassified Streptomyces TaxID=2593676 RepID=UPI00093B9487|nr:hypothetical protein [Streptomyces sp. TSRI0107]OKJ68428.1 hypothetical protein AMK31_37690 [Streptomyces sp. TSRI0107]